MGGLKANTTSCDSDHAPPLPWRPQRYSRTDSSRQHLVEATLPRAIFAGTNVKQPMLNLWQRGDLSMPTLNANLVLRRTPAKPLQGIAMLPPEISKISEA